MCSLDILLVCCVFFLWSIGSCSFSTVYDHYFFLFLNNIDVILMNKDEDMPNSQIWCPYFSLEILRVSFICFQ
jgi:hypothetical protein